MVDSALSTTSTNPVQNKVITTELNKKAAKDVATASANGLMSSADKEKLDGIEEGANKTVVDDTINSSSINPVQNKAVASMFEAVDKELAKKATKDLASTTANGLMSSADKVKLDGISFATTAEVEAIFA